MSRPHQRDVHGALGDEVDGLVEHDLQGTIRPNVRREDPVGEVVVVMHLRGVFRPAPATRQEWGETSAYNCSTYISYEILGKFRVGTHLCKLRDTPAARLYRCNIL